MARWNRTGSATVANGSTAVTGTLTAWTVAARAGDRICFDLNAASPKWYEIASVSSNTSLTLGNAYSGTAGTYSGASGAFAIDNCSPDWAKPGDVALSVSRLLERVTLLPQPVGLTDANKTPRINAAGTGYEFRQVAGVDAMDHIPVSLHLSLLAGTNTTNLRPYIQAAITFAATFGAVLYQGATVDLPPALSRIHEPLTLPGDKWVNLRGQGKSSGLVWYGGNNLPMISMDSGSDESKIFIERVTFLNGNGSTGLIGIQMNVTPVPGKAVVNPSVIENMFVGLDTALDVYGETDQIVFERNYVLGYTYGVRATGGLCSNFYINHNHFRAGVSGSWAVHHSGGWNVVLSSNCIQSDVLGARGIRLIGVESFTVEQHYFEVIGTPVTIGGTGPFVYATNSRNGFIGRNSTIGATAMYANVVIDGTSRDIELGHNTHRQVDDAGSGYVSGPVSYFCECSATTANIYATAEQAYINANGTDGVYAVSDYSGPVRVEMHINPNLLINGDFAINQIGFAGGAIADGEWGHDRWRAVGASNYSVAADVVTVSSGVLAQTIELAAWGLQSQAGKFATISIDAPSAAVWVQLGTAAAVQITSNGSRRRSARVQIAAGDTGNLTFKIWAVSGAVAFRRVKVEISGAATPWLMRPAAEEFALCTRYLRQGVLNGYMLGVAASTTEVMVQQVEMPLPMRATPAVTFSNPNSAGANTLAVLNDASAWPTTTTALVSVNARGFNAYVTLSTATVTAGKSYLVQGQYTARAEVTA